MSMPNCPRSPLQLALALLLICGGAFAAQGDTLRTSDNLAAVRQGAALETVQIDGKVLPGVSVSARLEDPRNGAPLTHGFSLAGKWSAAGACLRLDGEVQAEGTADTIADLIIRVTGAALPLSSMQQDPLLLPKELLSKLPIVSLRVGGADRLALAVPPDRLAIFTFREKDGAVELHYPLGFTTDAAPALRMRAPFSCVLYLTDPAWHYRSALAGYYALFPQPFQPFTKRQGGWLFAAEAKNLPNPQHFAYHEGGPQGWEDDHARGLGTYPYRESSSYTISLPGTKLPANYDAAMARFQALEDQRLPAEWSPQQSCEVDTTVHHTGRQSLLADAGPEGAWTGALQTVTLAKPTQVPITVQGFSKAEGVSGERDSNYAIYVDVTYSDGSYLFGQCATFPTGTHDWAASEWTIRPAKPVASLRVFCLLRRHAGKAWFDDIRVGPAADPAVNYLHNGSFETLTHRKDLQYVRDNVCYDRDGHYVVYITDNVGSDVKPTAPMNLLRFSLNVQPGIPSTPEHPAVAATEFAYYDQVFRDFPQLDGCYIDSVSAWCSRILNFRRDQWRYNEFPFTYDPATYKVAPHGRFAMFAYLLALQQRYHPQGKAVFTNIHVDHNSFPLYLVSDVPGIESSQFGDEDSMFFYRACSYHKPLILLNYFGLQGLEKREVAEQYHLNAAQWGEFPSTGRFMQRAYREYGDVTSAYVPVIKDLSAAEWQPIPLATGAHAERFGTGSAVYFTVRGAATPAEQTLMIENAALHGITGTPVALDAVRLEPLPLRHETGGWSLPLALGADDVEVIRVSSAANMRSWLEERVRRHVSNAARVQGDAGRSPALTRLLNSVATVDPRTFRPLLDAALASLPQNADDLFAASRRRELLQARLCLAALDLIADRVQVSIAGRRVGFPGDALDLQAQVTSGSAAHVKLLQFRIAEGREIVPLLEPGSGAESAAIDHLSLKADRPGAYHVTAQFAVTTADKLTWFVARSANLYIVPGVGLQLTPQPGAAGGRTFRAVLDRRAPVGAVELRAVVVPAATVEPPTVQLGKDESQAIFRVKPVLDGIPRQLTVTASDLLARVDRGGHELATAGASWWDEPSLPTDDIALASRGARCTTDSSYSGYSPAPLNDGIVNGAGLHWTRQAWASQDNTQPHWVQFNFPAATTVGAVQIYWAVDGGRIYTASKFRVTGLTPDGRWQELAAINSEQTTTMTRVAWKPTPLRAIRIEQPANGGVSFRPGIMWIREICVTVAG